MRRNVLGTAWVALTLCACQVASGLDKLHTPSGISTAGAVALARPDASSPAAAGTSGTDAQASASGGRAGADVGADQRPRDAGANQPTGHAANGGMGGTSNQRDMSYAGEPGGRTWPVGTSGEQAQAGSAGSVSAVAGAGGSDAVCVPPATGGAACDTSPQCGCGHDESCVFYDGHLACIAAGGAGAYQACRSTNDCARGYQCQFGACARLCDQTHPDCDDGAKCTAYYGDAKQPIPGAYVCESTCNLQAPQLAAGPLHACGAGLTCSWTGSGSVCGKPTGSNGLHGQLCTGSDDCAPGYNCLTDGTCAKYCATSNDCADGFSCDLKATIKVASTSLGICRSNCAAVGNSCGPSPQCGCSSDLSCDALLNTQDNWVHACRKLGSVPAYGLCGSNSDCGRGASCAGGLCLPFCDGTAGSCKERFTSCLAMTDGRKSVGPDTPIPGFFVCVRPCDPANTTQAHGIYAPCVAGTACDVTSDGRSYCRPANTLGVQGAACASNSDCAPRYTCATPENRCVLLCRMNGFDCLTGACRSFSPQQFAGDVEWGYCGTNL